MGYKRISISVCLKVGYPPKGVSCFFLFSDGHWMVYHIFRHNFASLLDSLFSCTMCFDWITSMLEAIQNSFVSSMIGCRKMCLPFFLFRTWWTWSFHVWGVRHFDFFSTFWYATVPTAEPLDSYIVAHYLRVWYVEGLFPFSIRYIFINSLSELQVKTNCKVLIFGEISQGILKMILETHKFENLLGISSI